VTKSWTEIYANHTKSLVACSRSQTEVRCCHLRRSVYFPNYVREVKKTRPNSQIKRIRKDQQYAVIWTTALFYVLAPTCFGGSLPSSGSFLDSPEILEIQIKLVVYHIMCDYVTCVPDCRDFTAIWHTGHVITHYDIPTIWFVFQVIQDDGRLLPKHVGANT
jgi:hypothetical protein